MTSLGMGAWMFSGWTAGDTKPRSLAGRAQTAWLDERGSIAPRSGRGRQRLQAGQDRSRLRDRRPSPCMACCSALEACRCSKYHG